MVHNDFVANNIVANKVVVKCYGKFFSGES